MTLQLVPGQRISSQVLCEVLNRPIAGVRYAMQRLAAEGLLEVRPRSGTTVAPLSIFEVREAYMVRTSLEALAARLASKNCTRAELGLLRSAIKRSEASLRNWSAEVDAGARTRYLMESAEHLHRFHQELAVVAGNQLLDKVLLQVTALTERFEYFRTARLNRQPAGLEDYWELLDAIASHDPDRAADVVNHRLGATRWTTSTAEVYDVANIVP